MDSLTLTVRFKNYSFLIVECDYGIAQEISEYFSFYAKNYRYMPAYKNHTWDGRIKLFNASQRLLPVGLLKKLVRYCKENGLDIVIDDEVKENLKTDKYHIDALLDSYNLPFDAYEHQVNAIDFMVNKRRGIVLSPTSSGKSLNIYATTRHVTERDKDTLIIVPTVQLVKQLSSDFIDYGWDSESLVHQIYSGQDKQTKKPVTISTWQSLQKMPESYFSKFEMVIVDECHLASASVIKSIMEKCTKSASKIGLTGTLDESKANEMTLIALFGEVFKAITTKELMNQGLVADLKIKCIQLNYPEDVSKVVSKLQYVDEVKFLKSYQPRTSFLVKLALMMKDTGNSLVLFQHKAHGKELFKQLKEKHQNVFYLDGDVDVELRVSYTHKFETDDDVILVASYGVFSTGINTKNLHNILFASSYKSKVKVLQSIGRELRLHPNKDGALLFDIGDNFKYKKAQNTTYKHFVERIKLYEKEQFDYKLKAVVIKG